MPADRSGARRAHRQRGAGRQPTTDPRWERYALDDLRNGNIAEAVAAYNTNGRVVTADNADALRQRLVDDWFAAPEGDRVMIATRRADVRDLNDRARALLDAVGRFGDHRLHVDFRIQVADREFAVGDQVMATGRNHYDLDILNGDLGTVTRINESRRTVTFHSERVGEERTMPTDRLEAGYLDHAYTRTNHKTQGATADRVFTLGDDGDLDRQAAYTALSRDASRTGSTCSPPTRTSSPPRPHPGAAGTGATDRTRRV